MIALYQEKKDLLYYQAYLVQDSGRVSRSQIKDWGYPEKEYKEGSQG